jgi:hypothetical protein
MRSYPFQPEFIFVVVVFLLILFVSNYGSSNQFTPYVHTTSQLHQYPYEGFVGDITPEPIDPNVATNPLLDVPRSELLQGYPLMKPNVSNDIIGNLSSSHECIGNASNLSNSTGGICFDQETIGLIKTRGGNQTSNKNKY